MKASTIDVVERLRRYADPEDLKVGPLMMADAMLTAADTIERLRAELAAKEVKRPQSVYFRADGTDLYGMEAHRAYHQDMIAGERNGRD